MHQRREGDSFNDQEVWQCVYWVDTVLFNTSDNKSCPWLLFLLPSMNSPFLISVLFLRISFQISSYDFFPLASSSPLLLCIHHPSLPTTCGVRMLWFGFRKEKVGVCVWSVCVMSLPPPFLLIIYCLLNQPGLLKMTLSYNVTITYRKFFGVDGWMGWTQYFHAGDQCSSRVWSQRWFIFIYILN